MQNFIDNVFGSNSYVDQSLDAWMVHNYDLTMYTGGLQFSRVKAIYEISRYDCLKPVLKTPMYHSRQYTSRESRLALDKRNKNVPQINGVVDVETVTDEMLERFVEGCLDDTKLNVYNCDKIRISENEIHEWLRSQPTVVVDQIVPDYPLHLSEVNRYNFSIKRTPKPNLTIDATRTYAALQTIVYHEKHINALFCAAFKELKLRVMRCLKDYIHMFTDMSPDEFAEKLTQSYKGFVAMFSGDDSYIFDGAYKLEIDISKYDKSQGYLALCYDCKVMRFFGFPEWLVDLWFNGHVLTLIYDRNAAMKCLIPFQRKSGDASTFILNTIFLMGVISHQIPLSRLSTINLKKYCIPDNFAYIFNLEVKFFSYEHPYFCSKFLLFDGRKFYFVPDPLKLLVKLGRSDMINKYHVECYRRSVEDSVRHYSDMYVPHLLVPALRERYNVEYDYHYVILMMANIHEKEFFSSLYFEEQGANIDKNRLQFAGMRDEIGKLL